jgi:hypothetical protein
MNYEKNEQVSSIYKKEISLTDIQTNALSLFSKNGFSLSTQAFETFAKSHGVFKNSLIESINDACFEIIDDVLIEEEEENFHLNEPYYKQILAT